MNECTALLNWCCMAEGGRSSEYGILAV